MTRRTVRRHSSRVAGLLLALATANCGSQNAEQKAKPETPTAAAPAQHPPQVDAQRIEEIAAIDKENQEQIHKVSELEQRLASLQSKLSGAIKPSDNNPSQQVTVASTGTKVRVRMPSELLFASGSARITDNGRKALEQVASVLKDASTKRIEVAGHTDNYPISKKYQDNLELSMERAHRVGAYLITQGIDSKRLVLSGYGDTDPVDPADTAEARAKNRRVEIFIEPTEK